MFAMSIFVIRHRIAYLLSWILCLLELLILENVPRADDDGIVLAEVIRCHADPEESFDSLHSVDL